MLMRYKTQVESEIFVNNNKKKQFFSHHYYTKYYLHCTFCVIGPKTSSVFFEDPNKGPYAYKVLKEPGANLNSPKHGVRTSWDVEVKGDDILSHLLSLLVSPICTHFPNHGMFKKKKQLIELERDEFRTNWWLWWIFNYWESKNEEEGKKNNLKE